MKLVKPTEPPSMGITVDTLLYGIPKIYADLAEPTRDRVDIVYIKAYGHFTYEIGIVKGLSVDMPMESENWPLPLIPNGSRPLAKLIIHRGQSTIFEGNIVEFE